MPWDCPPIIIQNTSISHAKRQIFSRAPNFISEPRLFTIQKTSNSQSKTHLRTPFLQNNFPYLLCACYDWSLVTASKWKCFSFTNLKKPLIFTFYFKTLLIIKELHENKLNTKVFHNRDNSENRLSEFSVFMKCFKKYTGAAAQRCSVKKLFLEMVLGRLPPRKIAPLSQPQNWL